MGSVAQTNQRVHILRLTPENLTASPQRNMNADFGVGPATKYGRGAPFGGRLSVAIYSLVGGGAVAVSPRMGINRTRSL